MKRVILLSIMLVAFLGVVLGLAKENSPASEGPDFDTEFVVVRAYFDDPTILKTVTARNEPWEIDREAGYIVLSAAPLEYEWLESLGFRLEVDEKLTALYSTPNERSSGQTEGIPGYSCYRTVEETFAGVEAMVLEHPNLAAWIDVGDSWEKATSSGIPGYDIMVLKLTNGSTAGPKPKLLISTGVHAREYAPPELNMRFAEYLIDNYDIDADVTWLLDYHEIHLLLLTNPDGRKHAETGVLWRKNTNEDYCSSNTSNRGADINRNFEFQWGGWGGSSGSECDSTYRGPAPGSEPETQALQNYGRSIFPDQRDDPLTAAAPFTATGVYLDIHSYGDLVLWPWGFTDNVAPNGTALQTLGRKFAYFNGYDPSQSISLYPADGTTEEFGYGELGLATYTIEMGSSFFQSCAHFEDTIVPGNLPVMLYAAKVVRTPYLTPAGPDALDIAMSENPVDFGATAIITATINDTRFDNSVGTEPVQNIAVAEYYIDVPPWITTTTPVSLPLSAVDGAFDNPIEIVAGAIDTAGLEAGRHTIFVRGKDEDDSWGPFSSIFLLVSNHQLLPLLTNG